MMRLLQRIADGLYAAEDGAWTADAALARVFSSAEEVLDFCTRENLSGVALVLHFDDSASYDVRVPLMGVPLPPEPGEGLSGDNGP